MMKDRPSSEPIQAQHPAAPYTASDLPVLEGGRIYHLEVKPENIAPATK